MKVGDRVILLKNFGKNIKGLTGTIIYNNGNLRWVIEFDEFMDGHDGTAECTGKNGYCWNVPKSYCQVLKEKPETSRTRWYKNGRFE